MVTLCLFESDRAIIVNVAIVFTVIMPCDILCDKIFGDPT